MANVESVLDVCEAQTPVARSMGRREACCVVCGQASGAVIVRAGDYSRRRCSCGTIYTTPLPADGEVDFTYDAHPEPFYALAANHKAEWLSRVCSPGRLLEVGCGPGAFLVAARQRGFDVHGLEPHPGRAAIAIRRHGLDVRREYLAATTWPASSFDVVYHCDMLSHFPDPIQSLQEMIRLLRPNGRLFFEVGLMGGLGRPWYWLARRGLEHHLWLYSEAGLVRLLDAADLEIEKSQSFGLVPYVVLGKTAAALRKLVCGGLLATRTQVGRNLAQRVESGVHSFRNWLRYSVGAWGPKMGPKTVLIVARPK